MRGGAGIATAPAVAALRTRASVGSRKKLANWLSFFGWSMLKLSLTRADQQFVDQRIAHALDLVEGSELTAGSGERLSVVRGREVVAQTPIVAAVDVAASSAPVLVSIVTGTSMAMALTA